MKLFKNKSTQKILSNIVWMLFDKVFILVLNLLVTVRIANYYGSLGYGTYQYAASVVALFEIVITFIDARVVKKCYNTEDPSELVWNATVSCTIFSAISIFGGILYLLVCKENIEYKTLFSILIINSAVLNLRFGMANRYEYLLMSRKVIFASNIALSVGGILQLIAVSLRLSIVAIAIINLFSSVISLIIIWLQYRIQFGKLVRRQIKKRLILELIRESLPLAIAASCAIIYSRCDSIMIGNMLSKSDVGIYAIAVKIINIVQIGLSPVRESVYPQMIELYNSDKKKYEQRYLQVTSLLTWIYIVGVLASFVVLPFAFRFLNPEYEKAYPLYQIYVIGTFFMYNAALRAGHYTLINRGNILLISTVISMAVNIVLNYFGIRQFGINGAAIATAVTQCISLMISNLFFHKDGREIFCWQIKAINPKWIFIKVDERN